MKLAVPAAVLMALCCTASLGQQLPLPAQIQSLDPDQARQQLRPRSVGTQSGRELRVIAPTLAPEEIDRAVFNRLLQEIAREPDRVASQVGLTDTQLQDLFITLSNSRSFINDNEMAAIRMMCTAWDRSELNGEARIEEALQAYDRRKQFTKNFVARYYDMVLADMEAGMDDATRLRFQRYLDDRRRRMANAGTVTNGITSQNVTSGAESIAFHCRPRP